MASKGYEEKSLRREKPIKGRPLTAADLAVCPDCGGTMRWLAVVPRSRNPTVKKQLKKLGTPMADYVGSVEGKVIAIECKWPKKIVDALTEALAKRILTDPHHRSQMGGWVRKMQSKRRKVMLTEEVTEVSLSPILCPIPKAATLIGRGVSFIYDAIASGKIKAVKSDKRTLVIVKSLHEYVSKLDEAVIKPRPKRAHHRRKKNPQPSIPPQKRAVSPSL